MEVLIVMGIILFAWLFILGHNFLAFFLLLLPAYVVLFIRHWNSPHKDIKTWSLLCIQLVCLVLATMLLYIMDFSR